MLEPMICMRRSKRPAQLTVGRNRHSAPAEPTASITGSRQRLAVGRVPTNPVSVTPEGCGNPGQGPARIEEAVGCQQRYGRPGRPSPSGITRAYGVIPASMILAVVFTQSWA
jgi:hypothetical protein